MATHGHSERKEQFAALVPILELFEDTKILKIVHAAQADQECLFTAFGVFSRNTLDTAVAGSLCGLGDSPGLATLCKSLLGVTLQKGHARTNWSARPLPPQLIEYAHLDVHHLIEISNILLERLDKLGRRQWAFELSKKWEDPELYLPSIESIASRIARNAKFDKKTYAALIELVKWREARVREVNVPRRWMADDQVLADIARVKPKDVDHLSSFRGLNKGEIRQSGNQILEALKRAEAAGGVDVPRSERSESATEAEEQVVDLLKCYLGILADTHEVALRHIVVSAQLLSIVRLDAKVPGDFVTDGVLSQESADLVGQEIIDFLAGRKALSIDKGRVKVVVR